MNLTTLNGRSILLLGKSRALTPDEFETQTSAHGIAVTRVYDESVALIVEGRMPNPIEQDELERLYALGAGPMINIDELERALCEQIDGDRLMMSLKLSGDRERLQGFLQNPRIDDALFLRLLGLYDWQGEGFFDIDENRDVTAALIGRFYENLERNHNVQYAAHGLMHLVEQTDDATLIEAIAGLEPLRRALKNPQSRTDMAILGAIASHPKTPASVLKRFVKSGAVELCVPVALRPDLPIALQQALAETGDDGMLEALCGNERLDASVADRLFEHEALRPMLAQTLRLDEAGFARWFDARPHETAKNPSLDEAMQARVLQRADASLSAALAVNPSLGASIAERLHAMHDVHIDAALASNEAVPAPILEALGETGAYHAALALNPATPASLLERLARSDDAEVLSGVARNPSTPVEVLYQLGLDMRLERFVKENPSYGRHIQTDNIGWLL